jgi:predicted RNase H-like nuclease (RuvC/YqgF family)
MLLKSWKLWIILAAVVSFGVLIGYTNHLKSKLDLTEQKLAIQEQVIQQKESEIKSLVVSIEKQNAAIEKLHEETAQVNGALSSVAATNRQLISKMNSRIASIMNEVVPKDCSGAMENLSNFAAGTAKEWNR